MSLTTEEAGTLIGFTPATSAPDTSEDDMDLPLFWEILTDCIMVFLCIFLYYWDRWRKGEFTFDPIHGHAGSTKTIRSSKSTLNLLKGEFLVNEIKIVQSRLVSYDRIESECATGDILVHIKNSIHTGTLHWKDYTFKNLMNDIQDDIPLLWYVTTWYKVLHSILFVYVDGENRPTQTDAYIYDLIVPLDLTLVLAFILGAAVVSTLGKYLNMRDSIRTSVEAICGCLQNIAMIISTMDLDDNTRFRRYCQLNAIHFLSFTAASMDKRYDDIEGLYNVNLITRKEYEVLKKPFITKKKLALLKRFYREVLTDMKNTNQQEDRLVFTQLCGTLRAKMGGGGLKLATQLYPPPAHAAMNRGCAYTFLFLLPVMCWEANSGHINLAIRTHRKTQIHFWGVGFPKKSQELKSNELIFNCSILCFF